MKKIFHWFGLLTNVAAVVACIYARDYWHMMPINLIFAILFMVALVDGHYIRMTRGVMRVLIKLRNDYQNYMKQDFEKLTPEERATFIIDWYINDPDLLKIELEVEFGWYEKRIDSLKAAALKLRRAQIEYIANRGNDALGKMVAICAKQLDAVLKADDDEIRLELDEGNEN